MQRYFAKSMDNDNFILEPSDLHHIKNVMRMKVNDQIEIVYNKIVYRCEIISLDPFAYKVISQDDSSNEMETEVVVAIGLVKEQKMDLILQKLTELGVSKIIPVKMERSIVKLDNEKFLKKKKRWETICKEASEQSFRNSILEISDVMTIKELVNVDASLKLVCSVKETEKMLNDYLHFNFKYDKIILVIGPEGGISSQEEKYLNDHGYNSVSLGKRVLRVETAAIYVGAVLSYIMR